MSASLSNKRAWQAYQRFLKHGVTDKHRAILSRMAFDIDHMRGDWVSLFVQGKRPLGNSSREYDLLEAVGRKITWGDDEDMPERMKEQMWNIFDELPYALPHILANEAGAAMKVDVGPPNHRLDNDRRDDPRPHEPGRRERERRNKPR